MSLIYNLSIRNKLVGIILFVTLLSLGIGFTLVMFGNIKSFKDDMKNNTTVTAQVVGEYCISPLLFNDGAGAEQILATLADVPTIVEAKVYDAEGQLFAEFPDTDEPAAQSSIIRERSSEFVDNHLHVYQPLIYQNEYYGTIYLQASTRLLDSKIKTYLRTMLLIAAALTLVSVFLAVRLQRIISGPILNLADVAQHIAEEKDYSLRVQKKGDDETGLLYDGFNNMLRQIQDRELERDKAEHALRESEEKFRTLTSNIPGAVYRCANDPDWTVDFISDVIKTISGYPASDFIGNRVRSYASIIHPDDTKTVDSSVQEAVSRREPFLSEYRIIRSDGEIRWVYEKGQGFFSDNGNLLWLDGAIFDITERKHAEEELEKYRNHLEELVERRAGELTKTNERLQREVTERKRAEEELRDSEEKFRRMTASALDAIIMMDDDGRICYWNEAAEEIFGYSAREALGQEMHTFLTPRQYHDSYKDGVRKFKTTGRGPVVGKMLELTAVRGDGTEFPVELSVSSVKIKGRWHSIGLLRDITERKKSEEAIQTRLRYEEGLAACSRTLLTGTETKEDLAVALSFLLKAADVGRVYIVQNIQSEEDGLGMRRTHEICAEGVECCADLSPSPLVPYRPGFQRWKKLLAAGEAIRGNVENFPDPEREVLSSQNILSLLVLPITVDEEWYGFIGFDDTREKREWSDEDIRSLRTASEMVGIYIETKKFNEALRVSEERFRSLVENANDIIYSLNPEGVFSYVSPNWTEILGHQVSEVIGKSFMPFVHPDDLPACEEFFNRVIELGARQSGIEYRIRHKNMDWRWHTTNASALKDEHGNVVSYIGIAHDFTEMKKILNDLEKANEHLRETQAQLVQSAKMASLGKLVAGIAHEINTPIGAVNSMQDTLFRTLVKLQNAIEKKFSGEPKKRPAFEKDFKTLDEYKKVILSGTDRVINIVRRLRSFARLDEAELKTVDIHEGLEDTLTLVHHDIKHNIEVKRNYGTIPPIACYPGRLNQVFLNILVNAKQAIQGRGIIEITTYTKGKKAFIEIRDNGEGIEKENLKKIFDPGFTTKGVGVGTGLGLSICYQIMEDHRGEILVDSEKNKGTTFTVVLPTDLAQKLNRRPAD